MVQHTGLTAGTALDNCMTLIKLLNIGFSYCGFGMHSSAMPPSVDGVESEITLPGTKTIPSY